MNHHYRHRLDEDDFVSAFSQQSTIDLDIPRRRGQKAPAKGEGASYLVLRRVRACPGGGHALSAVTLATSTQLPPLLSLRLLLRQAVGFRWLIFPLRLHQGNGQ